jgi:hypothetical protein
MSVASRRWPLLLVALLLAALGPTPSRRITIIGASVSDGFGVRLRTTRADGTRPVIGVNVATILQTAAHDASDLSVRSHATSQFFMAPGDTATRSVRAAIEDRPTLVLAIDWLFWSVYGLHRERKDLARTCDERTEGLERALATLQPLVDTGVPIVLGDLPDMRDATDGGMLSTGMVPDAECLERLNARIRAWVAERPSVALLDLSDVVRRTLEGKPVRACNRDWCETDLGPLMQKDRLHPTLNGTLAVVAAALECADRRTAGATSKGFDLDPALVRRRLGAVTASREGHPGQPAAEAAGSTREP